MKSFRLAFLLFPVLSTVSLVAAGKPMPGYYLTQAGDTVRCQVDFRDWNVSPVSVEFTTATERKRYTAADISGFGVDELVVYESKTITFYSAAVTGNEFSENFSNDTTRMVAFLKPIVRGKTSLYELSTPKRTVYFLQDPSGALTELVFRVRKIDNKIDEDREYRSQLADLVSGSAEESKWKRQIDGAAYRKADLAEIVAKVNGSTAPATLDFRKRHRSRPLQIFLFGGIGTTVFRNTVPGFWREPVSFSPSSSFYGGVKGVYALPGTAGAFRLGLQFSYLRFKGYSTRMDSAHNYSSVNAYEDYGYTDTLSFEHSTFSPALFILYNLSVSGNIAFHLVAGGAFRIRLKGGDIYNAGKYAMTGKQNGIPTNGASATAGDSHSLDAAYPQVMLGAGVTFGRHNFDFTFYPATDITPTTLDRDARFKVQTMCFSYGFNLLKPASFVNRTNRGR